MAPHSSTLAWKILWTKGPGGLQSMGLLGVGHDWVTSLYFFTFMHWRRKWQPTPVFLPGESQGREPGGLPSVGSHRVGHNWGDLAVAVAATLITEVILFSLKSLKRINFTLSVKCFLKKRKTADPKKAERKHWKEDRKFRFENLHYLSLNSQDVK